VRKELRIRQNSARPSEPVPPHEYRRTESPSSSSAMNSSNKKQTQEEKEKSYEKRGNGSERDHCGGGGGDGAGGAGVFGKRLVGERPFARLQTTEGVIDKKGGGVDLKKGQEWEKKIFSSPRNKTGPDNHGTPNHAKKKSKSFELYKGGRQVLCFSRGRRHEKFES